MQYATMQISKIGERIHPPQWYTMGTPRELKAQFPSPGTEQTG